MNDKITLEEKSKQNLLLLNYLKQKNTINKYIYAIAGRAYYSVFQKIKFKFYFLFEKAREEARKNNEELKEKKFFPHGDKLAKKINEWILQLNNVNINIEELKLLDEIDSLYHLRYVSDYYFINDPISEEKIINALKIANEINAFLDKLNIYTN